MKEDPRCRQLPLEVLRHSAFAVTRFDATGAPDPTFGLGGKVTSLLDRNRAQHAEARAVAVQPDGKVVVVGWAYLTIARGEQFAVIGRRRRARSVLRQLPAIDARYAVRMPPLSRERFEELVADALDALPEWVMERLDNVDVFVEDGSPPGDPALLGHYHGVPLSGRGFNYSGVLPDRIVLYRSTIERVSGGDEGRLRSTIAHTVAHEIAHHFGISDERLLEIDAY